uniref:Uncharacterized protein n=1 Tax=Parascaris equorum TaxID=6256 RepID=A0A914RDJ0_PAREQ
MRDTLIAEYGHPHGEEITFAWDHLHFRIQHRCCGMDDNDGDHIWAQSTWFRKQTKYPKKRVPLSCCPTCANVHQRGYLKGSFTADGSFCFRSSSSMTFPLNEVPVEIDFLISFNICFSYALSYHYVRY